MTQTNSTALACPACGVVDSIELDAGERLCLACRHEWNPTRERWQPPPAPPAPESPSDDAATVAGILAATTPEDVLAAADDDTEPDDRTGAYWQRAPFNLAGQFVTIAGRGNTPFLVVEDEGGDAVRVAAESSDEFTTPRAGLLIIDTTDERLDYDGTPLDAPTSSEPLVGVIASVASLVLSVGAEAVANDESRTLLNPRIGWLPPPASDIPEVEQGAAYAVAILIQAFDLDADVVIQIAQSLMAGAAAEAAETDEP